MCLNLLICQLYNIILSLDYGIFHFFNSVFDLSVKIIYIILGFFFQHYTWDFWWQKGLHRVHSRSDLGCQKGQERKPLRGVYYAICVKPDSTIEIRLDLDESYEFFE